MNAENVNTVKKTSAPNGVTQSIADLFDTLSPPSPIQEPKPRSYSLNEHSEAGKLETPDELSYTGNSLSNVSMDMEKKENSSLYSMLAVDAIQEDPKGSRGSLKKGQFEMRPYLSIASLNEVVSIKQAAEQLKSEAIKENSSLAVHDIIKKSHSFHQVPCHTLNFFFSEFGFRTLTITETTSISWVLEKFEMEVAKMSSKAAFSISKILAVTNQGEFEVKEDDTLGEIIKKLGTIPKFALYDAKSEVDSYTIEVEDKPSISYPLTVFTTVARVVQKLLTDLKIPDKEKEKWGLFKKSTNQTVKLLDDDTPFNPWSFDISFMFKKVSKENKDKINRMDSSSKFIRVFFNFAFHTVSISRTTNACDVIDTLYETFKLTGDISDYELCYVLKNEIIPIGETSCPVPVLEQSGANEKDELILQRISDNTMTSEIYIDNMNRLKTRREKNINSPAEPGKLSGGTKNRKSSNDSKPAEESESLGASIRKKSVLIPNDKMNASELDKKTGKLANFFGVSNDDSEFKKVANSEVEAKRTSKKKTTIDAQTNVQIKIFLSDQTYRQLKITINTTVDQIKKVLFKKLLIKEPETEEYNVYEVTEYGQERLIRDDEKLYEIQSNWHDKQKFVFHKKNEVGIHKNEGRPATPQDEKHDTPGKWKSRIAVFFGVETDRMLRALNKLSQQDGADVEEPDSELKARRIQVDNIHKEGWLTKRVTDHQWTDCWCYIENKYFNIKFTHNENDDDESSDTRTIVDTANPSPSKWCLPLQKCVIFDLSAQTANSFELVFNDSVVITLQASSKEDFDDWIQTLESLTGDKKSLQTLNPVQKKKRQRANQGITISDFEILRVLGQGQYGKVYLCSQKSTKQAFAIKVLKKSENLKETENENRILRGLRHPFIVGLYYAFQTEDRLYLVMEYVNGGELFFHLSQFGKFNLQRVIFYAAELLLAMECLHGKGIVYRDLKLENILLDKDGHIKLADFGLSKQEGETSDRAQSFGGTVEYFSPEVLLDKQQSYPADWWAYGVVVFEMLCGFHPFYCANRQQLFSRIINSPIPFPVDIDASAKNLIDKLLIRDPRLRLGTQGGGKSVRQHPFFKSVDFNALFKKQTAPPFKPDVKDEFDVKYFDQEFTDQPAVLTPPNEPEDDPELPVDKINF